MSVTYEQIANSSDPVVHTPTDEQFERAVRKTLRKLGLSFQDLEAQAAKQDFSSAMAQKLWGIIGGEKERWR